MKHATPWRSVRPAGTLALLSCGWLAACAGNPTATPSLTETQPDISAAEVYPSTYRPATAPAVLIRGATVLTGTGERIEGGDVLLVEGRIAAVGRQLSAPSDAEVIDAQGRWVTPGLIDVHSHLGVYPTPSLRAHADGNEMVEPVTAHVWAEHAVWPQDPGLEAALAGGVTTLQILPGSGNLIGGRGVTLKNVPAHTYQAMKFPGAPHGLKMACGENPKRVYGGQGRAPMTRMGNVAGHRQAFADAQHYRAQWAKHEHELAEHRASGKTEPPPPAPKRDLKMETLAGALDGDILVHIHCYRSDEMALMLDMAQEFNLRIAAFHHAVEAYKVADLLAQHEVCAAEWADWWGVKMELYDGIQENIALTDLPPGGCAIVHSDSDEGIQRLNQEAAKAMSRGVRAGLNIPPERAIRWLTANAARALGIDAVTGTLEPGKMADVVLWNRDPFSVYALADRVFIDGVTHYLRGAEGPPHSDFLLGQPAVRAVAKGDVQ